MKLKKFALPAGLVVISLLAVACKPAAPAPTAGTNAGAVMEKKGGAVMAKLPITLNLAAQNNSGITGTVTITEVNGNAKVMINYTGGPTDAPQPAHIHGGSCATLGGILYNLNSPLNGASVTSLPLSVDQLLKQKPWAVNVHKSAAETTTYVACADAPAK